MQGADCTVESDEVPDFACAHRKDAADEHFLDVLGALRRAVDH